MSPKNVLIFLQFKISQNSKFFKEIYVLAVFPIELRSIITFASFHIHRIGAENQSDLEKNVLKELNTLGITQGY